MNYPDSVEFLYKLGNEIRTARLGLERVEAVAAALGHPERTFPSVHVAGTNGKGSTCAMIEAAARAAGLRTGLYTSPHLIEPTERVQIDGRPVSRAAFARAFNEVHCTAERLIARRQLDMHPTYFETVTLMGFLLLAEARPDLAVIEVGLGGRLDATNIIGPRVAVITPVDFDHERFLGNTIESIAAEKAGILKRGVPAVVAAQRPEAEAVILARAAEIGAPVTRSSAVAELPVRCPLAGAHQVENAKTAAAALALLGIEPSGIARARWPGRLELVSRHPDILLDGAHNPAGARALAEHIRAAYAQRPLWLIFAAMRDKALDEVADALVRLASRVILTRPDTPRAVAPESLLAFAPGATVTSSVGEALAVARTAPPETLVLVAGSLYLVGEARALLLNRRS